MMSDNDKTRVLIVEDEIIVALFLEDMLAEHGYEVAGVASRLEEGLARAEAPDFTLAVLDVHLNGRDVFPLADRLAEQGLPFVFATGYGARGIPERHAGRPVLQKPFLPDDLAQVLAVLGSDPMALGGARHAAGAQ
jgi:CheY-like chemotaxis protein